MKVNQWSRIQTFKVLQNSSLWILAILLPVFLFGMIWNQISNINSEFAANKKNIIVSLQTGDVITLNKTLAIYTQEPGTLGYEIFDKDQQLVKKENSQESHLLIFSKTFPLLSSDNSSWGKITIFWIPLWYNLIYFILITIGVVSVVALVIFRSWQKFSKLLVETIEIIPRSLETDIAPSLIKEIDELNFLFAKLQQSRKQEIQNQKLLLLREKESALIELSQKVAHDIRSPLSAISLITSTFSIREEQRNILQSAIQRMNEICSVLLKTKRELKSTINLNLAVQQIISEKKASLENKEIQFSFSGPDESLEIFDVEFKDVLSNLLQNSIESIDGNNGKINILARRNYRTIEISVEDNGKGIPEELLQEIGKSPISFGKGSDGNGLGLYNAKKWIASNGGHLNIQSSLFQGTKITFNFEA